MFLTGGLLIVSFVCLVLCNAKKNQITKQFPMIDCTLPQFANITIAQVVSEYKINQYVGFTSCFCSSNIAYLNYMFVDADNQ